MATRTRVRSSSTPGHPRRRRPAVLLAALLLLVAVAAVAPLRQAASNAAGRAVLLAVSPFAPDLAELEPLPHAAAGLHDLPDHVIHAVLAAEDTAFYSHPGVNGSAIVRAAINTATSDRLEGGSTITQQLAKINYLGPERTVRRKMRELLYTRRLEELYTKDELLERYVNQVYYGQGVFGIVPAAQLFYGAQPQQLTVPEAAMLAGKIRAPQRLNPWQNPEQVRAVRDDVLRSMQAQGWLSGEELEQALNSPLGLSRRE